MTENRNELPPQPFRELPAAEAQDLAAMVRTLVANDMEIESIQTTRDQRQGAVMVQGRLLKPSHDLFPRWLAELNARGFTPMLRPRPHHDGQEVTLQVLGGVAPKKRSNPWINIVLFIITAISTLWVGSLSSEAVVVNAAADLFRPGNIIQGWPFALTLLGILGAHEFGHYFAARYHKVAVTLPYFIPMPFGFGTLGAFIRLKEPVPDRRKLFDIGVAGPLAGLVLAIPLLFYGLSTSPMTVPIATEGSWLEGNSVLYYYAKIYTFGKPLPDVLTGEDVIMNQVTTAAWIGLLVTALNLLPVGQLDGGHTVFALFGEKARYVNLAALTAMAVFAVSGLESVQAYLPWLSRVGYTGWFVWLGLIFFLIGPYHPPALDDVSTLNRGRRLVGYLVILIFLLTFTPVPLRPL